VHLSCDYSRNTVPNVLALHDQRNAAAAAAYTALAALAAAAAAAARRGARAAPLAEGLVWLAGPFALASNALFPVATVLGERLLYLPSAGFCLLAAALLQRLPAPAAHAVRPRAPAPPRPRAPHPLCTALRPRTGARSDSPPRPPTPPPRTKWTRRVPHPVLIGHAASLTTYARGAWRRRRGCSAGRTRRGRGRGTARGARPRRSSRRTCASRR